MEALAKQEHQSQENEFEIGSADGLHQFREYVEEAYRAILAGADNSIESDHFTAGKAAYEKVKSIIAENLAALEEGKEMSDETIETLQSLYDEMWSIADALAPANDNSPGESLADDNNATDLNETMEGSVIIEEAEGAPEIKPLETTINDEAFAAALESARTLRERISELLQKYQSATQSYPDTGTFNAMAYYYDELKASSLRVNAIANTLERPAVKESLEVLEFKHFEDGLEEIIENIDQLEQGIEKLLNPTADDASPIEEELATAVKPATGALSIGNEEREIQTITITRPTPETPPPQAKPRAINARLEVPLPRAEKRELQSVIGPFLERALREPKYARFVAQTMGSVSDIETEILRRINEIEKPSKFNKVFGFTYESVFHHFLKNLTVADIDAFERQPNTAIREALLGMNIEYETYVQWLDVYYQLVQAFTIPTTMTFGELFIRGELEDIMNHYQLRDPLRM